MSSVSNKMPDELREAFDVLEKYEYQNKVTKNWHSLISGGYYQNETIRLKKEKPLTVEEALKLERVYVPFPTPYADPDYDVFGTLPARKAWAEKGAAYATPKGAIAHSKMWLDMKVGE